MQTNQILASSHKPTDKMRLIKIVNSCKTFGEFKRFIHSLDEETRYKLVLQTDSHRALPIEIIKQREDLNKYDQEAIFQWLLKYTLPRQYKKLNEKINVDEVLKRYDSKLSENRQKNIRIACEILNKVRDDIQESRTAPQTNSYTPIKIQLLDNKIVKMHALMNVEYRKKDSEYEDKYPNTSHEEFERDAAQMRLQIQYTFAKQFGIGNCEDYSYVACYYAQNQYHLSCSVLSLHLGDHVVSEMDNDVIIDAWSGDVFLKEESDRFYDYKSITDSSGREYNIVFPASASQQWVAKALFKNNPSLRALSFFSPKIKDTFSLDGGKEQELQVTATFP